MPFLKGLFSGKKLLSEEEQREVAASVLREAENLALDNPRKAVAVLGRKGKPAYDVLRIGGPMHMEFRSVVENMWSRQSPCELLPSSVVEVICWDSWEYPTIRDITARAEATEAEVLYLTPPPKRSPRDALAELEALRLLRDPKMAMVSVGEEGMFFRRSLILEAGKHLPADSEEIGQDMMDLAKAQGLQVGVVVV
jgi:hypothetical protein